MGYGKGASEQPETDEAGGMMSHLDAIRTFHADRKISLDDFLAECEARSVERERLVNGNGAEPLAPARYCSCDELLLHGERLPCPKYHSCSYVAQRSALVPKAVLIANKSSRGRNIESGSWRTSENWSKHFGRAMERLVCEAGLLNGL